MSDTETNSAGYSETPRIAMNSSGETIADWDYNDESIQNDPGFWHSAYRASPAGAWSSAQAVPTVQNVGANDGGYLGIDSSGNATLLVHQGFSPPPGESNHDAFVATRAANGSWSGLENISGTTYATFVVGLAEDGAGDVATLLNAESSGSSNLGAAADVQPAGGSYAETQLDTNTMATNNEIGVGQIAIGSDGEVAAVWQDNSKAIVGDIEPSASGAWGSGVTLEPAATGCSSLSSPAVGVDGSGNVTFLWACTTSGTTVVQDAVYTPGSGLGAAQTLDTISGIGKQPELAVNSSGAAIAVWQGYNSGSGTADIRASVRPAGGSFGAAQTLSTDTSGEDQLPQAAIDGSGDGFVVWESIDTDFVAVGAIYRATSSTSTGTSLASSANPSTPGQQVTYTATVTPAPNGGTVSFTDDGVEISGCTAVTPVAGAAQCRATYAAAGSHTIEATYSGDANYSGSQAPPLAQVVASAGGGGGTGGGGGGTGGGGGGGAAPASTSTALGSSANPVVTGQQVTYSVTVSPAPSGGSIEFLDHDVPIPGCATVAPSATGAAHCTVSYPAPGTHLVQASYGGDATFTSSQSATLTEVVQPSVRISRLVGGAGQVSYTMSCAQSSGGCRIAATLTATEALKGSVVVAIGAAARTHKRTVIVGSISTTAKAGQAVVVTVKLKPAGLALLKRFGKLPTNFTVALLTGNRRAVLVSTRVTVKPASRDKAH
jgi:Bacterial Ig-like domain (group 3)